MPSGPSPQRRTPSPAQKPLCYLCSILQGRGQFEVGAQLHGHLRVLWLCFLAGERITEEQKQGMGGAQVQGAMLTGMETWPNATWKHE